MRKISGFASCNLWSQLIHVYVSALISATLIFGTFVESSGEPLPKVFPTASPANPDRPMSLSSRSGWRESFEDASPSWRVLHADGAACVSAQQRTNQVFQQGKGAEMLQMEFPAKTCLVLGHSIGFPMVINDLQPSLCVKSDGPGIVVGVQVVLPNALHPETGKPITFLVAGTHYSGSGEWERLGFWGKNGDSILSREVDRIGGLLRAEFKTNLDLHDRYVRQILLFVESGSPQTAQKNVWIDTLEVTGHVPAPDVWLDRFESAQGGPEFHFDPVNYAGFKYQVGLQCAFIQPYVAKSSVGYTEWASPLKQQGSAPLVATPKFGPQMTETRQRSLYSDQQAELKFSLTNQTNAPGTDYSPAGLMRVKLLDRVLYIDDVPVGVRAIEYQGEPLARLRQLGFNTVWVRDRVGRELLQEAKNAGIWIICVPPSPSELESATRYSAPGTPGQERSSFLSTPLIEPIYDNVLAWNLGDECSNPGHPTYAQWATVLQSADRARRRPILCTARSGVREYSRIADILMMDRLPLLSSLDLVDLTKWQSAYPTLARPDTSFWATIQTDADPKLANQWILFGGNPQDIVPIIHEQIKMQVYQALAVGTHGLLFTSNTPLTNDDPATEYRRTSLELINWELQLIEEWFASSQDRPTLIKSSKKGKMSAAVLRSGRTRLLVPIWQERDSQFAVSAAVEGPLKYVISGIPETYGAYVLVPGRLFPIKTPRVAGGMEVQLEEANLNSLVYFGEDDETYARVGERAKAIGPRAAYLACRLAELQLASTEQVFSALKRAKEAGVIPDHPDDKLPLISVREQESLIKMTKESIDRAKKQIQETPPGYAVAYQHAEYSTRGLRFEARSLLREATRHDLNACMTPVSVSFATLPYFLTAYQRTIGAALDSNRLPCGDMENVDLWRQSGWTSHLHKIDGIAPPVLEIASQAKRSGLNGLRIVVKPTNQEEKPVQLETPPIWVVSPPVPVRMGELICVNGWIRLPRPLEATVDGLMIYDSLGGEALALRFMESKGTWREFAFYRYVPADGNYFVFFSLCGLGEAHLDDISISAVRFEAPKPLAPPPQPSAPSTWQRLNPLQYLPPLPNWAQ